jgi:hypothetical protein
MKKSLKKLEISSFQNETISFFLVDYGPGNCYLFAYFSLIEPPRNPWDLLR